MGTLRKGPAAVLGNRQDKSRRVRPLLLVLPWIWAGCVFVVLSLCLDVEESDGIRPRAPRYESTRIDGHDVVGERIALPTLAGPRRHAAPAFATDSPHGARAMAEFCDAATAADGSVLREMALTADDALCAGNAVRALGRLHAVVGDPDLLRLVGDPRPNVRDQVILALGRSGRREAIDVLEPLLRAPDHRARILATQAVGRIGGPRADALLAAIVEDQGVRAGRPGLRRAGPAEGR